MVSGGYQSITSSCPSCQPMPIYILIGDQDYLLDLGEIDHPARVLSHRPLDVYGDAERMAVEPGTLVSLRHVGQPVGRFESGLRKTISVNLLEGIEDTNEPVPYATVCRVASGLDCNPMELVAD